MPDEPTTPPRPSYEPPAPARNAQPIIPQRQSPVIAPIIQPVNDAPIPQPVVPAPAPEVQPATQSAYSPTSAADNVSELTIPLAEVQPVASDEPDKVWINKEEYLRLQQAERASIAANNTEVQAVKFYDNFQIITTVIAAIALLSGLMMQGNGGAFASFLIVPSLIILAMVGAFTVNDKIQASKAGGYIKSHKGRNVTLMILAVIILASPILLPIGFILLMMIMCAGGGCKGT